MENICKYMLFGYFCIFQINSCVAYVFYVGDPAELVAEQLIRFNTQIFINIKNAFARQIQDIIKADHHRQFLAEYVLISCVDLQFPIYRIDTVNRAGDRLVVADLRGLSGWISGCDDCRRLIVSRKEAYSHFHTLSDLQELVGKDFFIFFRQFDLCNLAVTFSFRCDFFLVSSSVPLKYTDLPELAVGTRD